MTLRTWGVACLLFVQASLVGWIDWSMCPNKTEVGHMAAAVYFWHTLRFDVFHVNPPLARMVTALPVAMCDPECDWRLYSLQPQDRSEWILGDAFIKANDRKKVQWCFAVARWSLIPLLLVGGYFGYRLSREIYGDSAASVFLASWCFSPLLLGWAATICPDAVAGALGLVGIYALRQWLHKPNWMQAAVAGVCLGLLPLTKATWLIAFGIWPVIWCFWTAPIYLTKASNRSMPLPPFHQLTVILLFGVYTLNMGYLFDGTCRPLGQYVFISQSLNGREVPEDSHVPVTGNRFAGTWLGAIPVPLPAEFVQGIDTQRYDFERGGASYLQGNWSDHGWWYYYLYVLAVKMPLGVWCLLVLAIFCTSFQRRYGAAWRDEVVILLPCLMLFLLVSSQTGFSAHPRYILPALPFLFVGISRVGRAFTLKSPAVATLATLAVAYTILSSISVYPHSLSYFNELAAVLPTPADGVYPKSSMRSEENRNIFSTIRDAFTAGPRNGPRHLLGSNIDWGQDLFYLEDWYESHPEARPIKVAYFGGYPLDRSKVKSAGSPPTGVDRGQLDDKTDPATLGPLPAWYAVSVNEICGQSQQYRYFLHFQPVAMAGYSIYIYHITIEEANRVRKELGLPELRTEVGKRKAGGGERHG